MADDIRRWTKYDIDAEVESDGAVFVSAADHDREVARLTRERDLAIAHDTQPYPTAHAYERVCEVLAERDREVARLRAERDRAIETRENANRVSARAQLENERLRVAGNQLALAAADAIGSDDITQAQYATFDAALEGWRVVAGEGETK